MRMRIATIISIATLAVAALLSISFKAYAEGKTYSAPTDKEIAAVQKQGRYLATITMDTGNKITIVLEGAEAPATVANFVKLAQTKFYDGLTFHRVVPDFVIQGGDPEGTGGGGPGYTIKLEIAKHLRHKKGAISMARTPDPDTAGSQFFIMLDDKSYLDGQYAVFGWVKSGMDIVEKVHVGDKMKTVTVVPYKGKEPIPNVDPPAK
jgi:peptidyl-prolyl cis-trans isomerase B (cyclophilin B)